MTFRRMFLVKGSYVDINNIPAVAFIFFSYTANNEITAFPHNNRAVNMVSQSLTWKQRFIAQYNGRD